MRLIVFSVSLLAALVVTVLLAFVWEFGASYESARVLYPLPFLLMVCLFELAVGWVLLWRELRARPAFPVAIYPVLAFCFAVGCWAFTEFLTYDYALSVGSKPPVKTPGPGRKVFQSPDAALSPPKKAFTGALGEQFKYDPRLTLDYDPGRAMNKVAFNYNGQPIGALFITAPPPAKVIDDILVDVIVESTKKNSKASLVEHHKFKNRSGLEFHHFSCDAHGEAGQFRYELFLHVVEFGTSAAVGATKRDYFGMYKFEFLFPAADAADLSPMIERMVDSLTLNAQE